MTKETSPIARILAAIALVGAVLLVFVVISGSTDSDDDGKAKPNQNKVGKKQDSDKKSKSKSKSRSYEVQDGDTLTGIAAETGVDVEVIQELNPDLDPQALQAGAKLKLR